MGKLIYKKGSLFDAGIGQWLAHACNSRGTWGSGIAAEFRRRFPRSHGEYTAYCAGEKRMGTTLVTNMEKFNRVVCLITSDGFASQVDSPEQIIEYTKKALKDLRRNPLPATMHSNKFNSGLFKVPWEQTEAVLKKFVEETGIDWVIWDPNLEE